MAQKKETKIKNTLSRHQYDKQAGKALANDFLQLSKALERLKQNDEDAYLIMRFLAEENLLLEEEIKDRGKRIAKLQRNTNQQ